MSAQPGHLYEEDHELALAWGQIPVTCPVCRAQSIFQQQVFFA